jgi:hypothetical protein
LHQRSKCNSVKSIEFPIQKSIEIPLKYIKIPPRNISGPLPISLSQSQRGLPLVALGKLWKMLLLLTSVQMEFCKKDGIPHQKLYGIHFEILKYSLKKKFWPYPNLFKPKPIGLPAVVNGKSLEAAHFALSGPNGILKNGVDSPSKILWNQLWNFNIFLNKKILVFLKFS